MTIQRRMFGIALAAILLIALFIGIRIIPAAAQAATVSAKGSGQVSFAQECNTTFTVCTSGGQGADFSFDFSGPVPTVPNQPSAATGTLSVKFRETGDEVRFAGSALIFPNTHFLMQPSGVCTITTATGTFPGTCSSEALEVSQPNGGNTFSLSFNGTTLAFAGGQVISGGMQID